MSTASVLTRRRHANGRFAPEPARPPASRLEAVAPSAQAAFEQALAAGQRTVHVSAGEVDATGCPGVTVQADGDATVRAGQDVRVVACGDARVHAGPGATVRASGRATVVAEDGATVEARERTTVHAGAGAVVFAGPHADLHVDTVGDVQPFIYALPEEDR